MIVQRLAARSSPLSPSSVLRCLSAFVSPAAAAAAAVAPPRSSRQHLRRRVCCDATVSQQQLTERILGVFNCIV